MPSKDILKEMSLWAKEVMPRGAGEVQQREARLAFLAGAASMISAMLHAVDEPGGIDPGEWLATQSNKIQHAAHYLNDRSNPPVLPVDRLLGEGRSKRH